LPDENRVVVSMFYMGDCSLKEISEFLGVSVNTVKGKLHRARQQLGTAMSQHYGRILKSHKLKGGFLMQFMEQIRHIPAPTVGFAWSGATIGKTVFSLITVLCVLIGLIGASDDLPLELSTHQIGQTASGTSLLPFEVALLESAPSLARSPVSGMPVAMGKNPLDMLSRDPTEASGRLIERRITSAANGAKPPNPQSSAVMANNAPEKLTFSGRVLDTDGEPVADAEILYSVKFNSSESVVRTEVDGTFRFESPRLELKNWERVSIIATHPDHALGWRKLRLENTADVEIQLQTPEVISGRVLNEDGVPIQNVIAQVQVLLSGNPESLGRESSLSREVIPISAAKTDANGEFTLRALPQGAAANLEFHAQGYAKEIRRHVPAGTKGLEFGLKREARIEGRLSYAETGAPVKRATIALQGVYPTIGWEQTNVEENGDYLLKHLAPGMYNVFLEKGPEGWTAVAQDLIKVVEGQTTSNIDLTLVRGGFITVRVTEAETDEPIANHHVSFHDAARPESQAKGHGAETDGTGAYRFRAAPGRALVYVSVPHGYLDTGQSRRYVDVVEGENVPVNFQFSKGVELAGRVLTEAGEPVPGVRITDFQDRYKEYGRSNELGAFTVRGLRVGQKLTLKAEHTGLGLRGTNEVEVQPDESVEIRLQSYARVKIAGRVINREGEPISSVNIDLMRWDPQRNRGISSTVAVTDGDGWFRGLELIVGDAYTITAKAEGYREADTEMFTATAEMTQIDNLILFPVLSQFFIEGHVTDSAGKPVRGARLNMQYPEFKQTLTDEDGGYRFEGLSMAVINELNIDHTDYAYHQFTILKSNQRHDLVLVKADGYITGKVVDADSNPIERARVSVEAEDDDSGYIYVGTRANVLGEFELKHIRDPIVSIYVSDNRGYKIFEGIEVNQRDLVLTLTPAEPRPEPTPEQQARRKAQQAYVQDAEERFKTLVNKPAPELAVAEWLSGSSVSLEDMKGKMIALFFWHVKNTDRVQWARLLNLLQEVYGEKGVVCIAICSADAEIETVKQYIAEYSLAYSIGLDSPTDIIGARGETFDRYAVGWDAPIILINGAGEITGRVWDSELEERIQTLLAD
ncbi:MAG: redoxin domain-containing protein, partial [Candidatus Poribacteria bacterium]|nr:redoxin domain-containing protein [Candidatus Poribacteria bacterium]